MFKGKRKQKFGQCDVIYNASQQNKNAGNKNTRDTVSPNHVVCDINFWYHRQLNHQQEASPRNFNQS